MGQRTIAVIGDVGGHISSFEHALEYAGVNVQKRRIPKRVTIVQVGDIVHKGTHSDECVALIDDLMTNNPSERYIQLVGNHESHYLGGVDVGDRPGVAGVCAESQASIARWWRRGLMRVAYGTPRTQYGRALITHAGLTRGFWKAIGKPSSPKKAASRLNKLGRKDPDRIFWPGMLVTGELDPSAGPLWAQTGSELVAGWMSARKVPFSQIHGHDGVWRWASRSYRRGVPTQVKEAVVLHPHTRWSSVEVQGRTFLSVDPMLGITKPENYEMVPLILHTEHG